MLCRRLTRLALAVATAAIAAGSAHAHLSIIRQGPESAETPEEGDLYGWAVATGDFNGDGHDDLVTGSPTEAILHRTNSGRVILSLGSAHGVTHVGARFLGSGDHGNPDNEGALFGSALAVADLNRDGHDDLIVGAPREVLNGVTGAGRIYLYYGTPNGLVPWVAFTQEDLGGVSMEDDLFGISIVTGHFNNDIYPDIAIGSSGHNSSEGFVFVRYGSATGPFGSSQLFSAEILGHAADPGDRFGLALATGNTVGDTHDDLIIGSPYRDTGGIADAGVCVIVPGGSSGLVLGSNLLFNAQVIDPVESGAHFGRSLAVLESGLYDRIVVGEPRRSRSGQQNAGRVLVVNTDATGPVYGSVIVLDQSSFGAPNQSFDEFGTSLATGYFEDGGWMDLAVGAPGRDAGGTDAGIVYLAYGGSSDIGSSGYHVYGQGALGEYLESGDRAGTSVAFGAFDATNQGALVIGVPGEDDGRGLVHVVAPWRQYTFSSHHSAIVTDCQGDLVFSQKPFEQVFIASTTKIMTVLLACERTQLPVGDPLHVPLNALYVVPAWVADDVGGSSADLEEREVVSLEDLMYLSLLISGNDAAHAIADLLHNSGGPWEAVPAFVDEMNARAQQLGMNNTAFNNPNGFEQEAVGPDMGDHYSTAWDMEILSHAAMLNPLFREISNATEWTALRLRQDGLFEHNFSSFQSWVLDNGWGMHGTGIKGGWTPGARNTWCVSAEDHGRVIATSFGTDRLTSSMTDAFRLLTLGLDGCGTWSVDEGWELEYLYVNDRIVAVANDREIYSMGPVVPASMQLDLFRTSSEPLGTNAIMRIRRETQLGIENNETVPFGIAPFDGLEGIWVRNLADWTVKTFIQVEGNGDFYDIPPDGTVQIPINPAPSSQLSWSITSHGADEGDGGPVPLSVQEIYSYDVQAGPEPSEPVLSVVVERSDASANDLINLEIDWFEDGGEYLLVVHDSDVVVGVDGIDVEAGASAGLLQLAPPAPNPFRDQTRIRLALREEAGVSVSIHDASGRLVREYPEATRPAGVWSLEWDGRNGRGSAASPGVYFFRVVVNGEPMGDGKLVRLE